MARYGVFMQDLLEGWYQVEDAKGTEGAGLIEKAVEGIESDKTFTQAEAEAIRQGLQTKFPDFNFKVERIDD
ncbi:hypothetical protein [Tellurirhabdus bombi]|uniref:hypothetical protein n=1 Tax=Tellurirhabdus bombi TaxID=2907205 RepID=UPI001F1EF664|nr:hypothetical protein [Tellurirhabdus bombi]